METRWVPLDECVDAVLARRVQNPSLTIGVLAAHASRARGWSTLAAADAPWPGRSTPRDGRRRRARSRRGDDGRRVDHGLPAAPHGRTRPVAQHDRLLPARPRDLRRLAGAHAASTVPASVREQDLADFVRHLGAERRPPLATSSIARVLSAVRGLHRFLAEEGVIADGRLARAAPAEAADATAEGASRSRRSRR